MAAESAGETEVSLEQGAELWSSGHAQLIDVRRDYEWDAGRIDGARHVEMNDIAGAAETIERDRPVIFYCRSGNRSSLAAAAFREAGWEAYNLAGGLRAWAEKGLPIVPQDAKVADPLPGS